MEETLNELRKLSNLKHVKLTDRGNQAILIALHLVPKGIILIPDQGGWLKYQTYPFLVGHKAVEYKTDKGVIIKEQLEKQIKELKPSAIIIEQPAGYFANHDLTDLKLNTKIILDITGSIGSELQTIADIVVCSFGDAKPINLGHGGFIATKENLESDIFTISSKNIDIQKLKEKLKDLPNRLKHLNQINQKIKHDLSHMDIIHKDKHGINVVVKFKNQKEKEDIINYCNKNSLEYTECPRYIRTLEQAICIEVKRWH